MFRLGRFRLHDQTRRRVCIAGFFAFCVAPSALLGLWGTMRQLPGHVQSAAAELAGWLGLDATLERIEHPRPGVSRYHRLELADPETGAVVATAPIVEIAFAQSEVGENGRRRVTVVNIPEAQLSVEATGHVRRLIAQLMALGPSPPEGDVRVNVTRLAIRRSEGGPVLRDASVLVEHRPEGSQTTVTFRPGDGVAPEPAAQLAEPEPASHPAARDGQATEPSTVSPAVPTAAPSPQPIRFRVVRRRENPPVAHGFELDTAGGWVACSLLGLEIPGFATLGPEARFKGYFWAIQSAEGGEDATADSQRAWDGELIGQFDAIELGPLAEQWMGHQLAGRASLTVQSARFRRGRIEQAAGILIAGPGKLGRSLLLAARGELGLLVAPWTDPTTQPTAAMPARPAESSASMPPTAPKGDTIAYDQLACAVVLDARGARLQGRCALGPGVVAAVGRQWIMAEPPGGSPLLPVASWVRLATGSAGPMIPNSQRAQRLARLLPVP
mgnify:CR=1 FL=1